jgi:hypothetical protein
MVTRPIQEFFRVRADIHSTYMPLMMVLTLFPWVLLVVTVVGAFTTYLFNLCVLLGLKKETGCWI